MKTGIELITEERSEQIEKHGISIQDDLKYKNEELLKFAIFCLEPCEEMEELLQDWHGLEDKIYDKDRIEQLKIAGALIAAEIDRMQASS